MSIKPILFNTEMVQANLDGRKNNTRRIMKPQPVDTEYCNHEMVTFNDMLPGYYDGDYTCACRKCGYGVGPSGESVFKPPYVPGDILYARETWRVRNVFGDIARGNRTAEIEFKAGGDTICVPAFGYTPSYGAWKPSIHMPKEAARLFLLVKNVRVERLQDIDEEGAKAEGANFCNGKHVGIEEKMRRSAVERFSDIWNSTIKPADIDLYGWDANPWVWVIEYERCEKPVEVNCNG